MENVTNIETIEVQKPKKRKLNLTSYSLLTTHGFNLAISIFVSTFLISYIYSISENYVLNIGLFYCFNYLAFGSFSYFVSKLTDKTNRIWSYRAAVFIRAVFIILVVFLGKKLASVVVLAGFLHGLSEACYWCSYNVLKNELIPNSCMNKYATLQIIENKGVNFVVPIVLGKIIDAESFKTSAIIILVVVILQLIVSFFIKSSKPENAHFSFKEFYAHTKSSPRNKEVFKLCFITTLVFGSTTLISPINTIIVMLTFNSNFSLGMLTGVFSAVSIIMLILAKRFSKPGKKTPIYVICAVVSVAATIVVTFVTNKVTLIIFNFAYIACATFYSYYYDVYRNVLLKKLELYDDIAEYQCLLEMLMAASRVTCFVVMIVTGLIGAAFGTNGLIVALKCLFVLAILMFASMNWLLYKYEKKLIKHEILWYKKHIIMIRKNCYM